MILLTGASGFVGRAIKRIIPEVVGPSHKELELSDFHAVKEYFLVNPVEAVIHCAVAYPQYWENTPFFSKKIQIDIAMAANLAYFAPKMIALTSGCVYANHTELVREEDVPLLRQTEMGWIKFVISTIYERLDTILELRPFGIYGPGEIPSRFPSYCFRQIDIGEPILIQKQKYMSYIYVEDLAHIIKCFLESPELFEKNSIYNVADPVPTSTFYLAKKCMEIAKKEVPIYIADYDFPYTANVTRLLEVLPFNFTSWEVGLTKLYDSIKICN